jgi:HPt (histidine-containing phosphotransfer) domain-containing protein
MFDDAYLKTIAGENQKFIADILNIFLKESKTTLQLLQTAVEADNKEAIQKMAHKLKSGFHAIGASSMAEKAKIIEHEYLTFSPETMVSSLADITTHYNAFTQSIEEYLSEHA